MGEPARNLNHAAVTEDLSDLQNQEMTGVVVNDELASGTQRVIAIMIDGLVTGVIKGLLSALFMVLTHKSKSSPAVGLITNIVPLFYFVFMQFNNGQTLGKKVMKIRTIGDESYDLSFGQILGRETIGRLITIMPFFLGYLGAWKREDHKTFHDRIFRTKVIKVN